MKIIVTDKKIVSLEKVKEVRKFVSGRTINLDIFYFNDEKNYVTISFEDEIKMEETFQKIAQILRLPA